MNNETLLTPQKVPLPPSPPSTATAPVYAHGHGTPGLGIDQALTPGPDLLVTPNADQEDGDQQGDMVPSHSASTLNTPTKRPTSNYLSPKRWSAGSGKNGHGKKRVAVLEDFELIRVVGKGCAGRVMMVRHTSTATVHAMKAISKRSILTHDELPHTLTEVQIMKHFATHEPHNRFVAKLNYAFTDKENVYFVMDFYPGGDLATQMEIYGILGPIRTRFYACDIAMGLEDLHRHGIIVRDLKPENVLIDKSGHAVLADFGLAKDFGYRGEPASLSVPSYPGRAEAPYWAGGGAGSLRPGRYGQPKVTVDRAYSFVGTPEYLAPEVVRRGEYTYAIDWWGLGCIVLEGLIGRVPFKQEDDETLVVLWDKILTDPWQDVFTDPKVARHHPEEYGLDATTVDFIDGLLQKDPMWRLTEPHVRSHPYFSYIEWDLVRRGEYEDPFGLEIHSDLEHNTTYFPKLCLDETPTVDMREHDHVRIDTDLASTRTALNDDQVFAWEHLKAKPVFDNFAWSRDEVTHDTKSETEHQSTEGEDEEPLNWSISEYTEQFHEPPKLDLPALPASRSSAEHTSEPRLSSDTVPSAQNGHGDMSLPPRPSSVASPSRAVRTIPEEVTAATVPTTPTVEIPTDPLLSSLSPAASLSRTPLAASTPKAINDNAPSPRNKRDLILPLGPPGSGLSTSDIVSIPSPDPNSPTRLVRRHTPGQPSIDTVANARLSVDLHGTISRLGDDDWEQLEASSIPSLPNAAPSAFFTRGFSQVLRRRPSTLVSSSLRRQTKNSDSSRESSPTKHRPLFTVKSIENTKKAFRKAFPIRLKRDSRSKDKDHPAMPRVGDSTPDRPATAGAGAGAGAPASAQSPSPTPTPGPTPPRPSLAKRSQTESRSVSASASAPPTAAAATGSWFSTRKIGRSITRSNKPSKTYSSSSSDSGTNLAVSTGQLHLGPGGVPRVELTHTPAIVWELDKGKTASSGDPNKGGVKGSIGLDKAQNSMGKEEAVHSVSIGRNGSRVATSEAQEEGAREASTSEEVARSHSH